MNSQWAWSRGISTERRAEPAPAASRPAASAASAAASRRVAHRSR
jgi:hypothetical protein